MTIFPVTHRVYPRIIGKRNTTMILTSSFFPDPFDLSDYSFSLSSRIREEQYECSKKAVKELTKKYIQKGEVLCTLVQLQAELISRGVSAGNCKYEKNDFAERLDITLADTDFNITIPLFPKQNPKKGIKLIVGKGILHEILDAYVTPKSAADFILGVSEWLPEYYGIEQRIKEEEMQKQKVRDLAIDLLKRYIGAILEEKGYKYVIYPSHTNKASLIITFSDIFRMTLEVDLMEDFLDQVRRVVESLPANEINMGD